MTEGHLDSRVGTSARRAPKGLDTGAGRVNADACRRGADGRVGPRRTDAKGIPRNRSSCRQAPQVADGGVLRLAWATGRIAHGIPDLRQGGAPLSFCRHHHVADKAAGATLSEVVSGAETGRSAERKDAEEAAAPNSMPR